MAKNPAEHSDDLSAEDLGPTTRVQELTWMLYDDVLSDNEFIELEGLLKDDPAARNVYVSCAQLHVDLAEHFQKEKDKKAGAKASPSSVLSFLGGSVAPITPTTTAQ